MILYIIRHGDPDYEHDTITEYGNKEAAALADWFDTMKIEFDRIYTSPLGRAKDTASYTCQTQSIVPEVLEWTEESVDYMQPFEPNSDIQYRFTANGIEDYQDFSDQNRMPTIERMIKGSDTFLKELGYERIGSHYKILNHTDEKIAVFCHGGFGSAWTAHLLGMAPTIGFSSMFMTTTCVNVFEFRPYGESEYTRPRMFHFGDVPHLHAAGIEDDRL